MRGLPVNLPKPIFGNMAADNFEYRNLPYGMVMTILFDFWGVALSEEPFIAPYRLFDRSFINHMLSHIYKPAQAAPLEEEEDIPEPRPQHTSPAVPPTNPYSTLLAFINQLALSHNQLRDDFYSTASQFATS